MAACTLPFLECVSASCLCASARFEGLPAGDYRVELSLDGFEPRVEVVGDVGPGGGQRVHAGEIAHVAEVLAQPSLELGVHRIGLAA